MAMGTVLVKERKNGASVERLTDQQQTFVMELLASPTFHPTEAAKKAGYKSPQVQAFKLLKKPAIQAILGKALRERRERCELKADLILQEVAYCAMRDPIDLCDENGKIAVDNLHKLPERIRRCIDSFKIKRHIDRETGNITDTIELRLAPKIASLELAMKHLGLFSPEKHEDTIRVNWDDLPKSRNGQRVTIEEQIAKAGE